MYRQELLPAAFQPLRLGFQKGLHIAERPLLNDLAQKMTIDARPSTCIGYISQGFGRYFLAGTFFDKRNLVDDFTAFVIAEKRENQPAFAVNWRGIEEIPIHAFALASIHDESAQFRQSHSGAPVRLPRRQDSPLAADAKAGSIFLIFRRLTS